MTQAAGMIETVKDALLADLRARYGELVGDPTLDITLIVPPTFNRETRAPQIILTDFSTPRTFISAVGQTYMNEDRAGGTIDELNDPPRHDLHFAVTAAARSSGTRFSSSGASGSAPAASAARTFATRPRATASNNGESGMAAALPIAPTPARPRV